jgi:glycosyltransferase involved in cell wall biosynthesis
MKQQRINIAHTSLFEADLLGGVAARLAGVPVITTLVNVPYSSVWLVDNPKLNTAKLAPVRWLRRLVLGACPAHNVAISNYVKQSSHKHLALAENKITVVRRAVSKEWMEPAPADLVNRLRVELHLNGAYPVLLNVGRLVPQKGQKYLIQGMPDVLRDFPKARLLIVGDGFLRPKLEQLRDSLGLGEQVHFLGNQIDVKALLQLCHIFVFPSIFEGLGVALLEAAALGRPCIASNVGPLPEIIQNGHSGLLVAPRSAEALAQAVIRLAGNEQESHAMGEGARETIVKRFLIDQTVKKLEAVYTEVLSAQT